MTLSKYNPKRNDRYDRIVVPTRKEALARDGHACVKCKSTSNLVVHHIDESRRLGIEYMNNDLSNLETLCRVCHAEVHGYVLSFKNPRYNIIMELIAQGASYGDTAKYLGITRQRVYQIIKRHRDRYGD